MKKPLSFLLIVFLFIGTVALVSCDGSKDNNTASADKSGTTESASTDNDDTIPPEIETHDHIYSLTVTVAPSCGVEGKQVYECVICGKRQHETSIVAWEHNYQYSSDLSLSPACTSGGKMVEQCNNCGDIKETVLGALGHDWHTRVSHDSKTSEFVIIAYCPQCAFMSKSEYRYKIQDVEKLVLNWGGTSNSLYGDLDFTYVSYNGYVDVLKAPYYRVYCDSSYLLIVRNTNSFKAFYSSNAINDTPLNFYKSQGCTVVCESDIYIDEYGTIQLLN